MLVSVSVSVPNLEPVHTLPLKSNLSLFLKKVLFLHLNAAGLEKKNQSFHCYNNDSSNSGYLHKLDFNMNLNF